MLSIKYKFPLILLLVISLFGAASSWISNQVIMPPFEAMDGERVSMNLKRGVNALYGEVEELEYLVSDWAKWDDSYSFVESPNDELQQGNLFLSTLFSNYKLDVIAVINKDNQLVWGKFYSAQGADDQKILLPVELSGANLSLGQHAVDISTVAAAEHSGIYVGDDFSMLYAVALISDSEEKATSNGRMLMGRFITSAMISEMREQTQMNFSVSPLLDKPLSEKERGLLTELASGNQKTILINDKNLTTYRTIQSENNKHLLMTIEDQSSLMGLGDMLINEVITWLLIGGFIIFLASVVLIRKFVVDPVLKVASYVKEVDETGNFGLRLDLDSNDEVGELGKNVDKFIGKLSESVSELNHLNQVQLNELNYRRDLETHLQKANKQLKQLAAKDSLTGLANRRIFDEKMINEWRRLQRHKRYLTLALIDIDYFKKYNDTYGHAEGDECLVRVSNVLKGLFKRSEDLVARYGGEEFAVILPECAPETAKKLGEDIVRAVACLGFEHKTSDVGIVTASVGVTTVLPNMSMDVEDLFKQADENLYKAKSTGRNQSWFTVMREADFNKFSEHHDVSLSYTMDKNLHG